MLPRIVQCLLNNPEESRFIRSRQTRLLSRYPQVGRDLGLLAKLLDKFAQGWDQAQVVERHRAQIKDEPTRIVENASHTVLEIGEFFDNELRVPADEALENLSLQDQIGHRLRRTVVHV